MRLLIIVLGLAVTFVRTEAASTLAAAQEQINQRKWADAEFTLLQVTAAEPKNATAWASLGRVHLARGNATGAVSALEEAAELDPNSSEVQRQLGDAYGLSALNAGMLGKFGFARKCKAAYEKAIALNPGNIDARWSLMEYCRQAPAIAGGGMSDAYAQAEEIRKLDANRGRLALASLYVAEKKMVEAFALYDEALVADPTDYSALYGMGRLCAITSQRLDQGLDCLRRCLAVTPPPGQPGHAPVNWRMGILLEKKGDKPGAKAAYEAAIAAEPNFAQARDALKKLSPAAAGQ
jgi:tetratricopeptide (TPR) repeat protein